VEKEMVEIDKLLTSDFKTFAKQLNTRQRAMRGLRCTDDSLDKLYDAVEKLSKLSH
jgi:hypothetical protein